jgi:phosphatidylglycerophosphate synthase
MLAPRRAYVDILMRYARRYKVVLATGIGGTAGVGWIIGSWIGDPAYPFKAAAFFAFLIIAVLNVAGADHPYPRFGPANVVTTIRAMLAAYGAGLIGYPASSAVLWGVIGLTTAMVVLDGLDGRLARATGMTSAYGARFDMEIDAAFILVLSILVWQNGKAGAWVLMCGLMRYAFVAIGRLLPWMAVPLRPTLRGRIVAVCQLVGLGLALAPVVAVPASALVAALTLAALAWSFAIDIAWLARQRQT